MTQPRLLPLHGQHRSAGARFMDFAGWQMPLQYAGILVEHAAVRERAGLFDVSHMGEFRVRGASAGEFLQRLTMNDVGSLRDGRAQYSGLLTRKGTLLDDLIVYRISREEFRLVVNASRASRDLEWLREQAGREIDLSDRSAESALLALQGPVAATVLMRVSPDLPALRPFGHASAGVAGVACWVARTGYTGEDGFELSVPVISAVTVWEALLEAGKGVGLQPAGLGARETLRLEAGLMLYGQDIDETTTPLEAGLERFVALDKGEFIGREALQRQRQEGLQRRLSGFEMVAAGVPRAGYTVWAGGRRIGAVTSGGFAPSLKNRVGLLYMPLPEPETSIEIDIRGRRIAARTVPLPFYRRGASSARKT